MSQLQKVLKTLKNPKRYVPVINKSPLRFLVRGVVDFLHRNEIQKRRQIAKELSDSKAQEKAHELQEKGYAIVTELVDPALLAQLREYSEEKLRKASEVAGKQLVQTKSFWLRLSDDDLNEKNIDEKHILTRFALQEPILKTVSAYLGELPVLNSTLLTYSQFKEGKYVQSQLWHQDRDDVRMVKMFAYLSDVSEVADGPFTFLDKPTSRKVSNSFFMKHLEDKEVFKNGLSEKQIIQMIKPALTVFLVDTSQCYHMGSRVEKNHTRMMYTALYVPEIGIYPGSPAVKPATASAESSELIRLVLK